MKKWLLLALTNLVFSPSYISAQHFTVAQSEAGIDHVLKHSAFLGGGAVFFDYDNDGDDDLYITAGDNRDHFYVNNGDGTFENQAIEAGFPATTIYYTTGAIAGDVDNDGFKDLFVTTWFSNFENLSRNLLFHNNGDGTFTEMWSHFNDKAQTMGATFLDFDLDGLLDIYVINYIEDTHFIYDDDGDIVGYDHDCFENKFYRNTGDNDFEEISQEVGLDDTGCALAIAGTDFDLDGDIDIYLANDFGEFVEPNRLFQNDIEANMFNEVGETYQANIGMYGMGIAVGDIDQDLDLDYYVTNFGKNILLKNEGDIFSEIAEEAGVDNTWIIDDSTSYVSWGTAFLDIDNDTDLDLYVANGYVPSPSFLSTHLFQNDKLYVNQGDLTFTDEGETLGIENLYTSRGMAYSDYDNDGDLDIVSVVLNVPINDGGWQTVLFRNEMGNEKNWLQVTLEGVEANRDAYGSKVYLFADGKTFMHEVSGGSSHCSQNTSRAHFGLGDVAHVDSVQVSWPGGKRLQTIHDLDINQNIYVLEDTTIADTIPIASTVDEYIFSELIISPNPASGWVDIAFGNHEGNEIKLEIINSLGQTEKILELKKGEKIFRVNVSQLKSGVYFFTFKSNEKFVSKKIIVQ